MSKDRAQGSFLGQLAGDALGSMVEFQSPESIQRQYPRGLRQMADSAVWHTIAGQPTDDSEMALMLARTLVENGTYHVGAALKAYQWWLHSEPFDCGATVAAGLRGHPNIDSQANGALMRISPLGIFGSRYSLALVGEWAKQDAILTHPHVICQQVNALFAMAIAHAVHSQCDASRIYRHIKQWAKDMAVEPALTRVIEEAASEPPADYVYHQGWVLIAFQNALFQLRNAPNLEAGVVDTIMRGGDTDTNAAICGALLGAVYGLSAIPEQWVKCVLNCRPQAGASGVHRPRPEYLWPTDALELAEKLLNNAP